MHSHASAESTEASPTSTPKTLRLLVADDHAVVRRGLRQIVNETPDLKVVAEASTGDEVLEQVQRTECDVVVLDLNMPGPGGLAVLRSVKEARPTLPVLVLSIHPEDQYAARLLRAGASGYLQKEASPDELVNALRRIGEGHQYLKPAHAEELAQDSDRSPDEPQHTTLSNREFEVLRGIASGRTVSQVATDLGLSVKTVSTYRTRLLDKMRMKTNSQLTHYAIKNRLVE